MASFIREIVQASISATMIVLVGIAERADADVARVKELLKSDDYVVAWGTAPVFDSEAELEIGAGNGHGGTFRSIRLLPSENGVDVLQITHEPGHRTRIARLGRPMSHRSKFVERGCRKMPIARCSPT